MMSCHQKHKTTDAQLIRHTHQSSHVRLPFWGAHLWLQPIFAEYTRHLSSTPKRRPHQRSTIAALGSTSTAVSLVSLRSFGCKWWFIAGKIIYKWEIINNWLVVFRHPSEKYKSQLGWWFPIYGKMKLMFQTTNQLKIAEHRWQCGEANTLNSRTWAMSAMLLSNATWPVTERLPVLIVEFLWSYSKSSIMLESVWIMFW